MLVSAGLETNKKNSIESQTMILIGVGLYMLVMLGIGFYASRGTHSATEFIVAGRSLPLWLCSVS
ncbi:MAG: hypothetical protein ACE1ZA_17555, partial [Pseudomonadales bacterium]